MQSDSSVPIWQRFGSSHSRSYAKRHELGFGSGKDPPRGPGTGETITAVGEMATVEGMPSGGGIVASVEGHSVEHEPFASQTVLQSSAEASAGRIASNPEAIHPHIFDVFIAHPRCCQNLPTQSHPMPCNVPPRRQRHAMRNTAMVWRGTQRSRGFAEPSPVEAGVSTSLSYRSTTQLYDKWADEGTKKHTRTTFSSLTAKGVRHIYCRPKMYPPPFYSGD